MKKDRILLFWTAYPISPCAGIRTEYIYNSRNFILYLRSLYELGKSAREDYDIIMITDFSSVLDRFGLACTITCLRMLYTLREKFGYQIVILPHYEDMKHYELED